MESNGLAELPYIFGNPAVIDQIKEQALDPNAGTKGGGAYPS
jgi:hypothetical protein